MAAPESQREYDYDQVWRDVYGDIQKYGPCHHHLCRIMRKMLSEIRYESVVDVGCGFGHNYALLTKNGAVPRFAGIDVSEFALDAARKNVKGDFLQRDIQRESVDGLWDLVVCSLVLEHLADDDAALKNMRPFCGRYLLVTSIAGDFERYRKWDETQGHLRNYKVGELERKIENSGFHVLKSIYWGFPFYSPIGRAMQNSGQVGLGTFNWRTRLIASISTMLYYLNSSRKGDLVLILAEPM